MSHAASLKHRAGTLFIQLNQLRVARYDNNRGVALRVPEKTEKQQGPKLFQPGQSGNPKGRPRGSRNRATLLAQELLGDEGETIMRKAIELAKKGDKLALKLCLERIVPRPGRTVEIDLPAVKKADDLVAACAAVIDSAAAGQLTLQEAREFMELLDAQRKAIETQDLVVRIELLEQRQRAEAAKQKKPRLGGDR